MHLAKNLDNITLSNYASFLQQQHEDSTALDVRKEKGQVFTPPSVCRFMAELFTRIPEHFRLLDAGSGVGSLASSVCERLLSIRSPRHVEIHLYESDRTLLPLLEANMRHCHRALLAAGHGFEFTIHAEDFILATRGRSDQRMLFDEDESEDEFDAIIMNPPYFKIGG